MDRLQALNARHYLGSVSHSMEQLPKWYQLFAISGILFVICFRGNPIVSWLVVNLHSSFGTEFVWYGEYQRLLEQMSFNERLCFTLYGVALAGAVALLYKLLCRDTYGLGWSASQLFPDRKGVTVTMFVVLCAVEMVRMRGLIAECLGEKDSLANIAIKGFAGLEEAGYDPRLASSNQHFVVQVELVKALLQHVVVVRFPVIVLSAVFRLSYDVPRKTHAALRWYMATATAVSAAREAVVMYMTESYDNPSPWATFAWAAILFGTINFIYGPSKRAGMVATATTANSLSEAVRAVSTCTALWCIASLLVLTFIVSVHVVELISLWLIIFLLIIWTPAIIDSCSTDYVTLLSGGFAWLGKSMGYLTLRGSVRFGLLLGSWWLTVCLLYNLVTNLAQNRYGGIAVVVWFFFWAVSPTRETEALAFSGQGASPAGLLAKGDADTMGKGHAEGVMAKQATDVTTSLKHSLLWLCQVADYDAVPTPHHHQQQREHFASASSWAAPSPSTEVAADHTVVAARRESFTSALQAAVLLSAAILVLNHVYSFRMSSDTKQKLRHRSIFLATPAILCRKAMRTVVLVFCVVSFLVSTLTFREYVLPHIVHFLPDFVSHGISAAVGCVVLGALMDTKDSMYEAVARTFGLVDPPTTNDDGTPVYETTGNRGVLDSGEDIEESLNPSNG